MCFLYNCFYENAFYDAFKSPCADMNRSAFLPYYLTLFTFSVQRKWPLDVSLWDPQRLQDQFSSFTTGQMQRFRDFSEGLKAYFEAPLPVFPPPVLPSQAHKGLPLFIIPSLILPSTLLHVMPEHSFLNFLLQQGFDPMVMTWPDFPPGASFEDVKKACAQAYGQACASSTEPPVVIGLREGILGALSLAHQPIPPQKLVLIDEPQGVFQETPSLQPILSPFILSFLNTLGMLPALLTRLFFSIGQSEKVIQKISTFRHHPRPALFTSVEDCLNQLPNCPYFLARHALCGDFSECCAEKEIVKTCQSIPTLLIQPQQKSLTFLEPLAQISQQLRPPLGSFGLLVSSSAPLYVWASLVKWLQKK